MALTLAQLESLCAVVAAGSLTAAAEGMHVAQSSLSRTMADIERRTGTPILTRGPRGVSLTVAGEELYAVAREILASRDAGFSRFRRFLDGQRGSVSIATLPSLAAGYLAPVVRRFRESHPDIHFSIKDGFSTSIIRQVQSGAADFGLTNHPPAPEMLHAEPLFSERMLVAMPPESRLATQESVTWAELGKEDIITLPPGSSVRPLLEAGFREAGVEVSPVLEARQLVTIGGMIASGLGVCPLPESAIDALGPVELVAVPLVDPVVQRRISLLWHAERPLRPSAREFLIALRVHARAT
jgi:DNA-binding transcriptional LysR family regulator